MVKQKSCNHELLKHLVGSFLCRRRFTDVVPVRNV